MNCYIITGASRGLGEAMALELLKEDSILYCISRNESERLAGNDNVHYFSADLTVERDLKPLIGGIFAHIDLHQFDSLTLINNAGLVEPVRPAGSLLPEEIGKNISLNLTAPLVLSSLFIERTKGYKGRRRILNISSGAGRHPYGSWSIYCSSKAGLDMFTQVVAEEQKEDDNPVQIASLAPGIVDTDMQALIRSIDEKDFSSVEKFKAYKRDGHLQSPETAAKKIISYLNKKTDPLENGALLDIRNLP